MKKILILGMALIFSVTGCGDLTEMNEDRKNPQEVPAGTLIANATKSLFDFMTQPSVNINNFRLWSQQWAQTTYADESNYILVERNINGNTWSILYQGIIRDLTDAKIFIEANANLTAEQKANQLAIADILQVFSYHVLVDIFGDVPYSEAIGESVNPSYDEGSAVYADLFNRLDANIAALGGATGLGDFDLVYGGDADSWKKFANSLKLRMAIRIADVNSSLSKDKAEEAVASGVFTSNDDNFELGYESATPNTNPLWVALVQSGRSDYVIASTFADPMNDLNDPRRDDYFADPVDGEYIGGVYGANNGYPLFSHPGDNQRDPTWPGLIMSYWEVEFLLADAIERGYSVGGTAMGHYNDAIEASILYWDGTAGDVTAYLAQPEVNYLTAPGTAFQKIALQKWLSLYDQGFEAWSSYRFYDYPVLPIAETALIPTPKRYTYPVSEYSLNESSVMDAGSRIGGDALDSPVFWDEN